MAKGSSPMMTMAPRDVLDLSMSENDAGARSIRGYLVALVACIWKEGERFNGKRPFGNSCWESELEAPLIKAGLITGSFDEEGWIKECDSKTARRIIDEAIQAL